jgi:uncharacterized UBP type Zn finger protein
MRAISRQEEVGQQSILEAFVTSADTDLQFCLDRYCFEIMDGDNQYHCSQCELQGDAKRELTFFQKLPPVLNVNSRYVQSSEFQKEKLSDKVLLPTVANAGKEQGRAKGQGTYPSLHLCAVMRHKGTSACSYGHYIGSNGLVDWAVVQFNDERGVTLLAEGRLYLRSFRVLDQRKAQTATADGGRKGRQLQFPTDVGRV